MIIRGFLSVGLCVAMTIMQFFMSVFVIIIGRNYMEMADVEATISGIKLPCTYTKEEFAAVLNESDEDYKAGRFVAQDELREKYGL